ncbi:hypothetical protein [Streptomyces olivaceoviridis]|uniref:hypothetical protein n=1 Tax=Streptomyces olivaceoviridis TaxID=1921 RepID=UPI003F4C739A
MARPHAALLSEPRRADPLDVDGCAPESKGARFAPTPVRDTGQRVDQVVCDGLGGVVRGPHDRVAADRRAGAVHAQGDGGVHVRLLIAPTNTVLDPAHPVHRNVTISGNVFEDAAAPAVRARSVRGLAVTGNHLTGTGARGPHRVRPGGRRRLLGRGRGRNVGHAPPPGRPRVHRLDERP